MANPKNAAHEQKTKMLEQIKALQKRINEFDTKRAAAVGMLAKKYKLTDLSDEILEQEFKAIQARYQTEFDNPSHTTEQTSKKN